MPSSSLDEHRSGAGTKASAERQIPWARGWFILWKVTTGRRIAAVAIGSHGDVLPFVALGQELRRRGHQVSVATHECFLGLVTSYGLEFRPLPMDPRELMTEDRAVAMRRGGATAARTVSEAFAPWVSSLCEGIDRAADDADVLILSPLAWPGHHSALARGIPSMSVHLQPLEPTRAWPPPALTTRRLPGSLNRRLGVLAQRQMVGPFLDAINRLRGFHGLAPVSAGEHVRLLEEDRFPVACAFSRYVVPRPPDWRDSIGILGYLSAPEPPGWHPPQDLTRFLADGPTPVYVGFGSTATPLPRRQLARVVRQALDKAGLRAVVHRGWGDFGLDGDDVLAVGDVPHSWLLPRTAAAVHHAGAGTTAAALHAGIPSVPVPIALDQHFWAGRVHRLGAATRPLGEHRLSGTTLAEALQAAVREPAYAANAQRLRRLVRSEQAPAAIADTVATLGG